MKCKIALCQMVTRPEVAANYDACKDLLAEAGRQGADIAILPEIWTTRITPKKCLENAEPVQGPAYTLMQAAAKEHHMYIFGGSIPIAHGDRIDNACFVFDRDGKEIGRYNKCHLFDIDVEGAVSSKESSYVVPGDHPLVVDTEFGKIGVLICYDIRFPNMFLKLARMGAEMIVLPAAFHIETGKAHWDFLTRARAVDTQVFMAAVGCATDPEASFVTYGHSRVVDPWGKVLCEMGHEEGIEVVEIETERVAEIRQQLQALRHQRPELYK